MLAAPELEIAHQVVEIDRRLDADLRRDDRVLGRERMLARLQHFLPDVQPGVEARTLRVRRLRRRQLVDQRIVVEPRHAVMRAGEQLQLAIGDVGGAPVLRVPFRRPPIVFDQARRRREAGERHVRRHVGRDRHRVDRDVEAAPLELPRAREPDRSAADDRRLPRLMLGRELRRHQPGAPGERHAGAAVPVVVHEQLVVQLVRLEDEAGIAMRPQADGRPDDPVPGRVHRREVDRRPLRREIRFRVRGAAAHTEPDRCHAARSSGMCVSAWLREFYVETRVGSASAAYDKRRITAGSAEFAENLSDSPRSRHLGG